jgi:hypothetical protein
MSYSTGICANCGASEGLHQAETMRCPKNGIEEKRYDRLLGKFLTQQWGNTFFEDSGLKRLSNTARDLLNALRVCHKSLKAYGAHPIIDKQVEKAIKDATGE